ncbi:A C2HC-type zinc-finger protein (macronuclear) [Tetrahymena thermophila SB210]|uniref:A C2HC-type zinc-finger protein n=1 Tax=Tetrahymena thermophila (strain SB210) TaxID=312017 RepID=Q22MG0_TETTS|nr:A C2HC-type zinc-finger protein [Tetrahymena thermophila SB210]EAR86311.2 A C2HC-type zinc-finger protein [Tetrahymena thermophila SB210]|eukprot:XP_977060.2 A C2HC-type zinc-finger protein [Tetrahymena thermophila SB210]
MNGEGQLNFVSDFQQLEQKERLDLNFDSLLDDQEKADAELNNSVFTFAQQHNSMIDDQLQLAQNTNQQPSSQQNSAFPSKVLLETNQNFQTYETCNNCNRQFFQGRLNLHQKSCKPQNPLKPLNMLKINNILSNSNEQSGLGSKQGKKKKLGYREVLSSRLSATPTTAGSVEKSVNNQNDLKFVQPDEQVSTNLTTIPKWKIEHQSLLLSIKPAQMNSSDFIYQQYVQCQYCLRKFKPQVAEQHIPNCKNIFNRPKPPKKQQEKENEGKMQNERSSNKLKIRKELTEKEEEIKNISSYENSERVNLKEKLFQINDSFDKSITQIKEIEIFQINPQTLSKNLLEKSSKNTSIATKKKFKHIDRKLSFFNSSIRDSHYFDLEKNNVQNQSLKTLNKVGNIELHRNKSVQNQLYDASLFGCDHLEQADSQIKVLNQSSSATQLPFIQDKRISNKLNQLQEIRENQGGFNYENVINRSKNYSQVTCPHCERIFSKNAAPRHIPICKTILNKPARPLKKSSSSQLQTLIKQNSSYGDIFKTNYEQKGKNKSTTIQEQQSLSVFQNQQISCFCTQCGSQLFYSFKYCSSCGKKRS